MDEADSISIKLTELLRHPEDLDKIASLKSEFSRKKGHVDTQLKAALATQLKVTQSGINAISDGQKTLNATKEEMIKIDKLCSEAEDMIDEFPLINKISKIHRNFVAVEEIKSKLQGLDSRLAEVDRMLADDSGDSLTNEMPNLLPVHFAIMQLQDFREDVMHQSERADNDVKETLEIYFSPLENTVGMFDERVGIIAMSLIELVRAGNRSLVVRLAKIIDSEERSDEMVVALQEAQNNHQDLATRFKSIQKGPKVARGYKEKFLACVKAAASAKFEAAKEQFEGNPDGLEECLSWYFGDLRTVKTEFVQLMPRRWKIFDTYLEIYHNSLHDFLKEQIEKPDLDGQSLLNIILWNGEYNKSMKTLGVKAAELKPQLIDGREADLLKEYSQLIVKKMEEWMNKIMEDDTKDFILRTHQPNEEDSKWHMPSVPTMFIMINQQLNIALDSNKGNVVTGVVDECVRLLKNRQVRWQEVIADDINKHVRATTKEDLDDLPDGILEYMMAVANDQIRSAAYTQEISDRVAPLLSKKYEDQVRRALEDAMNGFVDLATYSLAQIIEVIFNDLKPPIKNLFTPAWYNGTDMETMATTMRSYIVDLSPGLDADLFPAFMHQLSEKTCVAYLSGVHNKGAKFRSSEAAAQIRADVAVGYGFLTEFIDRGEVKGVWTVLEHFLALICSEKPLLGEKYDAFKQSYWDLPSTWVEAVIKCRDDKSKDMLEIVRSRGTYVPRGGESTIMSRFVVLLVLLLLVVVGLAGFGLTILLI
ncbi:exocyst complex component Sec6 [Choiromyces venosus 120613-1]|uniref:Exocyst complex component Sec6 n=1 Tax=Choiromyces venosus 120613-1 TaxID=1336337 RepID=A0A3N4ITA2_9PEZI|nr:exocyst complex component Sec6 [Choiromyces venosus 120613-1]